MANIGHAGATDGQIFAGREGVRAAGLHRHNQRGISGTADGPAEAIVLSGGYADDIDLGDEVIYTGEGGRDATSRTQVADQALTGGNAALVNSNLEGGPVRVFRKTGVGNDYRYDGLYYVERYWPERPPSHGRLIWRYRLIKASADGETVVPPPPTPPGEPPRVPTTIQRIVRSTNVAQTVKTAHGGACQVCGSRIELRDGNVYAEAAHIRPLGLPHNGPDVPENVLCLCPNDHVRFDYGAIYVDPNGHVVETDTGKDRGPLRQVAGHVVDSAHLAYHRAQWTLP